MPSWKPIATAPKDGSKVDLWFPSGYRVADCCWRVPLPLPKHWQPNQEAWCFYHAEWDDWVEMIDEQPTHWMQCEGPASDTVVYALSFGG